MTSGNEHTAEKAAQLLIHLESRLGSRVRNVSVVYHHNGVVLYGMAATYHASQLAQHMVMEMANLPVLANAIDVC